MFARWDGCLASFSNGKMEKTPSLFSQKLKTHDGVLLIASRGSLQRALRSAPRRRAKAAFEHRTKSKSAAPTLAAAGIAAATSTDASNHLAASSASRRRRKPCIRTVLF
jgi:hypothetical protein